MRRKAAKKAGHGGFSASTPSLSGESRPRRRILSDEERELWHAIGRSLDRRIRPFAEENSEPSATDKAPVSEGISDSPHPVQQKERIHPFLPPYIPPVSKPATAVERQGRSVPDFDTKTARKLVKGKIQIEARIDLHGMTQDRAHDALQNFLVQCHAQGKRMVLVITGKGRSSGGVLKNLVPRWLAEPTMRVHVSGYREAHAVHGGAGALYVRIKRREGPR